MTSDSIYRCRVCAMRQDSPPWGYDGDTPSYLICPCCGTEFGVDDCRFTEVIERRKNWKSSGGDWFQPTMRPSSWIAEDQLRQLDEAWTLESLDLDEEETPAEDTEPEEAKGTTWKPTLVDYYHYVANATLPTNQQTKNFAEYVTQLRDWHASKLFPPGNKFVFYLNPYAGFDFRGSQTPLEPVEIPAGSGDADRMPTREYRQRFGDWDFNIHHDWCTSSSVRGLRNGTYLPDDFVQIGTCHLTGFLENKNIINNAEFLHQDSRSYAASRDSTSPAWKRLLFGWIFRSRESTRYHYLVKTLEPYAASNDKSIMLDAQWVARESEIQGKRLRVHLNEILEVYRQHRELTVDEFWNSRDEILHDIADNSTIYFIDNGCVLGPERTFGRILGLIDEEYGWPVTFERSDLPTPSEWMKRGRCHPFIVDEGRCLAVCIELDEYDILVGKTV